MDPSTAHAAYCSSVSRPVRVLWLSKGLGPGGAERLLVSLARSIDHGRFELGAAYLLPGKHQLVPELQAAGVPATCLDGEGAFDVRWVGRLRSFVKSWQPDIVHVHSPQPAAMARPMVRALGRRRPAMLYTEHNSWNGYRPATRAANAATWSLDDYRLTVSQTALDSVPRWMRSRTEVLVHGVDLEEVRTHSGNRDRVRAALGVADDEILVVTVANLREHKDYPTLLAAARKVLDSGGPVRFVAVGQGPLEAQIRAEIHRLRLGGRFQLLGYRHDSLDVVAAGDIFCLSSLAEGYPVSLMEALALGRPVVATAVGGISEAIRDGVEGVLVPPQSPGALADALISIATDQQRLTALASMAWDRSSIFDIHTAVERHQEIYEALAGSNSRHGPRRVIADAPP